ncbi:MAG TPA: site-specific integrase [Solirubrobacteraceae bacterium]|nr:site-specific integrase [Solirubrobacteraceae bacterium]
MLVSGSALERVRVIGPLAGFADGYRSHLVEQGYSRSGARDQFNLLVHASRWMEAEGLELVALTSPAMLKRHSIWRREQGYGRGHAPMSLRGLIGYLNGLGVLTVDDAVRTDADGLVDAFRCYLLQERGLAATTVRSYEDVARRFLAERSELLADDLTRLSGAAAVNTFVLRESRRAPRSAGTVVCGLRALLRFLHVQGLIAEPLAAAVPAVARRREDLPRGLASGEVRRLLDSCDRSTPAGRRDYAILVLLSRLGLRCGEVAALELGDVDWRAGEAVIRGKGSRIDRLPLPADVGEALVDYLRHGRPRGFGRTVFLTVCAPVTGISRGTIRDLLVRACTRAGMPAVGAHRLRHTVASDLLSHGAGLREIGQVLRHQDLGTTALYAKVDQAALSRLALPWPESER